VKQILQKLGNGETVLVDVPRPAVRDNDVLIATQRSLISVGTERMLLEFGRSSLIGKARKQPEKVKQVLNKARVDGILTTYDSVKSKLAEPVPLGYCNAGIVLEVGKSVTGLKPGDRVVSNGPHAEIVRVGQNLCAKIPDGVSFDDAAFTVLASIGLQGIRLAAPSLGETVCVIGLGLIGLLTVQLLRSNGCRVVGIDPDAKRCALAASFGAFTVNARSGDPVKSVLAFTAGLGADAVLITASTVSDQPMQQAAEMSRKRGRIVLVGVTGLNLSRDAFYQKELTFQVSCSYGPGRYDPAYEEQGHDYPAGFVRWTEGRNFEAVLALLAGGAIDLSQLVESRYALKDVVAAYDKLAGSTSLGILIDYPPFAASRADLMLRTVDLSGEPDAKPATAAGAITLGMIGFGNFGSRSLAPSFKSAGAALKTVVNSGGAAAAVTARSAGFRQMSTDQGTVFGDSQINIVAVTTRHDTHADFACRSIETGKAAFVEKPLAITREQLGAVVSCWQNALSQGKTPILTVGFNRRFAPMVRGLKEWLDRRSDPASLILTINAGAIPASHWTQHPNVGGGRIIGEAVHFIDLARFLIGHPIVSVRAVSMGKAAAAGSMDDKAHIALKFGDGSTAVINYLANGSAAYSKERIEAFCGGGIGVIDNYRTLKSYSAPGLKAARSWRQDKGHAAFVKAFVDSVKSGGTPPVPFEEIVEVHNACFDALDLLADQ
jgi:threonine dehydrogenase-like Zn-dependent dehydrogenase/predicted dehydrogenase